MGISEEIRNKFKGLTSEERSRPATLLKRVQAEYGYVPEDALEVIAGLTGLPLSQIKGVATFYASFSLRPRGTHVIQICQGTACHVKGAKRLKERLESLLNTETGQTTEDGIITLEEVRCIGCCNRAPVVVVDGRTKGRINIRELEPLIRDLRD